MNLSQKLLKLLTIIITKQFDFRSKKKECLITTQVIGVDGYYDDEFKDNKSKIQTKNNTNFIISLQ
jgi:hypothetical protein